jgi:hypothetical protein
MHRKRKPKINTIEHENGTTVRLNKSNLNYEEFHDLWGDTTGDSADIFFKARNEMIRKLSKYTLAHLSYRIGMADLIRVVERELGQDGAEFLLRALAKENEKRGNDPEVQYVDKESDDAEDQWEDNWDDGDEGLDPLEKFLRFRRLMRKRRFREDDRDPMFG